jgi:hypothetical protein
MHLILSGTFWPAKMDLIILFNGDRHERAEKPLYFVLRCSFMVSFQLELLGGTNRSTYSRRQTRTTGEAALFRTSLYSTVSVIRPSRPRSGCSLFSQRGESLAYRYITMAPSIYRYLSVPSSVPFPSIPPSGVPMKLRFGFTGYFGRAYIHLVGILGSGNIA